MSHLAVLVLSGVGLAAGNAIGGLLVGEFDWSCVGHAVIWMAWALGAHWLLWNEG